MSTGEKLRYVVWIFSRRHVTLNIVYMYVYMYMYIHVQGTCTIATLRKTAATIALDIIDITFYIEDRLGRPLTLTPSLTCPSVAGRVGIW